MKTSTIEITVRHRAKTTPREIQACYMDYGHEWVFHRSIFFRDFGASKYEIISPTEHKINVTLVVFRLIKFHFQQNVVIHPGQSIVSTGTNAFGYPVSCVWDLKELGNGETEVTGTYKMDVPWIFAVFQAPLRWLWTGVRNKSWASDRVMLERRSELMGLGFGDGNVFPADCWLDKAEASRIQAGI